MRKLLTFTLALATSVALAAEPVAPPPTTQVKENGDPDQIVCMNVEQIGSRLNRRRVCRTRAEWQDLQNQERQVVDRVQSFRPCPPVC